MSKKEEKLPPNPILSEAKALAKPTAEEKAEKEPNIAFIGGRYGKLPEKTLNIANHGKVHLPDAKEQEKPFYHDKADLIISVSPWYKPHRPK